MTRDRGSAATEMVLLTPVLVLLLMLVVHGGRAAGAMGSIRHAADQGARAAALVAVPRMEGAARSAVERDLENVGDICVDVVVSTMFRAGRPASVTVTVSCGISTRGTSALGTTTRRVSASSTEVVDIYRGGD